MFGFHFILVLLFFVFLNVSFGLQFHLFSFIPDPLEEMFNSSFYKHYGEYLSPLGASTIWSVSTLLQKGGDLIGLLFLLRLVDTKGSKFGAIWLRFWMVIAGGCLLLLSYYLPSFEAFFLAGLCNGAGIELKWCTVAIFLTEVAPNEYRGASIMLLSFGEAVGQLLATVICRPSIFGNAESWHLMPAISLLLAVSSILYLGWIPESPKFLAEKKKYLKAEKSIRFYHGKRAETEKVIHDINMEILEGGLKQEISLKEIWNDEALRKVLILLFCIYNSTDISAISIEIMFFARLHSLQGLTPESIMTIGTISRLAMVPLFLTSSVAVEKIGRRKMILGALFIMYLKAILTMISLFLVFYQGSSILTQLFAIFSDIVSTMGGVFGPVQVFSLLCCELTPTNARVRIIQIISVISMSTGLLFSSLIPYAFKFFPPLPYIFLIFFQPILIVYVFRNLPETRGRAMYRIVEDFQEAVRSRTATRRTTILKEELTPLLQ